MSDDSPLGKVSPLLGMLTNSFEEGDTTKYSRTDVLRALMNPLGGLVVALPVLITVKAPAWIVIADVICIGVVLAVYVAAYAYCFFKRPDSLRSERFELTKYAIEQRAFGDNTTGLIEAEVVSPHAALGGPSATNAGPRRD